MLVVWQTVALALVAGWLLHRGLRGTRVGDEPRCRKCDYRLDGLTSQQCPECGTAISNKTVVHGTRVVGWRPLFLILLIPLLAAPMQDFLWTVPNIDWYQYYSADWLYEWAEADDRRSIEELGRRLDEDRFTQDQVIRIFTLTQSKIRKAPTVLTVPHHTTNWPWQVVRPPTAAETPWIQLFELLLIARKLPPKCVDNVFPSHQKIELVHRKTIRKGDPLVIQYFLTATRAGTTYVDFRHAPNAIWVNGQSLEPHKDFAWTSNSDFIPANYLVGATGSVALNTMHWTPGEKKIEYTGSSQYHRPIREGGEAIDTVTAVRVLPSTNEPLVGWADSPITAEQLKTVMDIYISDVECCFESLSFSRINLRLREPLDVPIAWSVALEIDGCEYGEEASLTDSIYPPGQPFPVWDKGETGWWSSRSAVDAANVTEVYVILRGDRTIGMTHPGISEIWKGELRFGPIPWEARILLDPENYHWPSSP